jgi:hypothetical protein
MSKSLQLSLLTRNFFGGNRVDLPGKRRSAVAAALGADGRVHSGPVTIGKSALCIGSEKLVRLLL